MKAYGVKRFQRDFDRSARTFRKARRRAASRVVDKKRQRDLDRRLLAELCDDMQAWN